MVISEIIALMIHSELVIVVGSDVDLPPGFNTG